MRRPWWVLVLLLLAAIGTGWWWSSSSRTEGAVAGDASPPASVRSAKGAAAAPGLAPDHAPDDDPADPKTKRRITAAERAEVRDKIVQAIEASRAGAGHDTPSPTDEPSESPTPEPRGGAGSITDRSDGTLSVFVGTINDDFMPLADECYAQARQTQPDLGGLLDLEFSIIADEEVGGLVDEIDVGKENEVQHEGMLECIRESMLSTYFPSPQDTGRRGVRLTMRLQPDGE